MITEGRLGQRIADKDAGRLAMQHLTMDGSQPATLEYIRVNDVYGTIAIKAANGMKVVLDLRQGNSLIHMTRC
jgi:hypothetical protein